MNNVSMSITTLSTAVPVNPFVRTICPFAPTEHVNPSVQAASNYVAEPVSTQTTIHFIAADVQSPAIPQISVTKGPASSIVEAKPIVAAHVLIQQTINTIAASAETPAAKAKFASAASVSSTAAVV